MRRYFLFIIVLLTSVVPAQAASQDLVINGDNVSYDKSLDLVEASGSVEVSYKGTIVTADQLTYDKSSEILKASGGFKLSYEEFVVGGQSLDYAIKAKKGRALGINFDYSGIAMKGRQAKLTQDEFHLKQASFTTCDNTHPHFRVTAADILLYPKHGWLVAYWGYFWLGPIPVLPMPTYIYDLQAESKGRKNLPPFPQVGNNDEDGAYFSETLAWHLNRKLAGTYSITYASKKGFGGGLSADYIINPNSKGNARLSGNASDGLWGGITHYLYFAEEKLAQQGPFLNLVRSYRYELETILSHRERINYERVSFYPHLAFRLKEGPVLSDQIKHRAEIRLGTIAEENNLSLSRGGATVDVYGEYPVMFLGKIIPSLGLAGDFYSNGTKSWWRDDKLHRDDGPAVIDSNGDKYWWINGKRLSLEEYIDQITDKAVLEDIVLNHLPGF